MTVPASAASLLAFVRRTETGRQDDSAYDTIYGHNERHLPKPLTSMTLDEVIALGPSWTKAYKSSAAGAYQFMNATLKDLKAMLGLLGNERMTPAFQDRLGFALLKRRGFEGYMAGTIALNTFGLGLSKEWASFPVLTVTKGAHRTVQRGETFYAGDKLNKALVKPEAVEAVLLQMKTGIAPSPAPAAPKRKTLMDLLTGWLVKTATTQALSTLTEKTPMNTNLLHNFLNIAIALVAVVSLPEVTALLPPDIGLAIVGLAATAKTVINVLRDGLTGLVKNQPPVR